MSFGVEFGGAHGKQGSDAPELFEYTSDGELRRGGRMLEAVEGFSGARALPAPQNGAGVAAAPPQPALTCDVVRMTVDRKHNHVSFWKNGAFVGRIDRLPQGNSAAAVACLTHGKESVRVLDSKQRDVQVQMAALDVLKGIHVAKVVKSWEAKGSGTPLPAAERAAAMRSFAALRPTLGTALAVEAIQKQLVAEQVWAYKTTPSTGTGTGTPHKRPTRLQVDRERARIVRRAAAQSAAVLATTGTVGGRSGGEDGTESAPEDEVAALLAQRPSVGMLAAAVGPEADRSAAARLSKDAGINAAVAAAGGGASCFGNAPSLLAESKRVGGGAGMTAEAALLGAAASAGDSVEADADTTLDIIAKCVAGNPASVNEKDADGFRPLDRAFDSRNWRIAKALVAKGATASTGYTSLKIAKAIYECSDERDCRVLLAFFGKDFIVATVKEESAAHQAVVEARHRDKVEASKKGKTVVPSGVPIEERMGLLGMFLDMMLLGGSIDMVIPWLVNLPRGAARDSAVESLVALEAHLLIEGLKLNLLSRGEVEAQRAQLDVLLKFAKDNNDVGFNVYVHVDILVRSLSCFCFVFSDSFWG